MSTKYAIQTMQSCARYMDKKCGNQYNYVAVYVDDLAFDKEDPKYFV